MYDTGDDVRGPGWWMSGSHFVTRFVVPFERYPTNYYKDLYLVVGF